MYCLVEYDISWNYGDIVIDGIKKVVMFKAYDDAVHYAKRWKMWAFQYKIILMEDGE